VQIVRAPSGLRIQVENSGEPIPPDRLNRLFEPYPSRHPDRQGLGLWVCYQIVTQLGGTIEAQADERSTRLCVHLPIGSEADHD
jgi:signal transduction histidine kinase